MPKTVEGFVNFVGDSRDGSKGGFIKGVDGWVTFDDDLDISGVKKGAKVKAQLVKRDGDTVCTRVKVLEKPGSGRSGGYKRGGGGGWRGKPDDPARQRSIVMQHSQTVAAEIVAKLVDAEAIKLTGKPDAKLALYLSNLDAVTAHLYAQAAEDGPTKFAESREETDTGSPSDDWDEDKGDDLPDTDDGDSDWDDD